MLYCHVPYIIIIAHDYSIPGRLTSEDPIQQAEDATNSDENSDNPHETNNEIRSVSLDETEPTCDTPVISCTSSSTLPATSFDDPGPAIIIPSTATALNVFNVTVHLIKTLTIDKRTNAR